MSVATSCRGSIRPPLKYHGGKYPIAGWIVSLMPEHEVYVEPFLGGGSVFLSAPGRICCLYDADPGLISMWCVLRSWPRDVSRILRFVSYGEALWRDACRRADHIDPIVAAAARIIRSRWSRGGMGRTFGRSTRRRGGQDEYVNSWETFVRDDLPAICERAGDAVFDCKSFRESIPRHDDPGTLLYCDPPYHPDTRTAKDAYDHEMSDADHRDLLDILVASRSKVMLSGYRYPPYDDALRDWNRVDKSVPNHAGQGRTKQRRVESIWRNF